MSIFPMKMIKMSARHHGDTKDYHVVLITTADDRSLFISRWGKKNQWGQMAVECFDDKRGGQAALNKKVRQKFEREYSITLRDERGDIEDEEDLRRKLGAQYWAHLGADNLAWLVPGADTAGVREPPKTEWEKRPDGSFAAKEKPRKHVVEEPPKVPTVEEKVAENKNWGIF